MDGTTNNKSDKAAACHNTSSALCTCKKGRYFSHNARRGRLMPKVAGVHDSNKTARHHY